MSAGEGNIVSLGVEGDQPSGATGTGFGAWPALVALGALAFLLLPTGADMGRPSLERILILRSVAAGCVAGIGFLPIRRWWAPAASAALSCALGLGLLMWLAPPRLTPAKLVAFTVAGLLVSSTLASSLAAIGARSRRAAQALALTVVLLMALVFAGVLPGVTNAAKRAERASSLSAHPAPEKYSMDGWAFLRAYDLMKQGWGYYDAFARGMADDSRYTAQPLKSPFNYREPFVFVLWRVLPGDSGLALWGWFVAYALLTMGVSYALASSLVRPAAAILAPITLLSHYTFFFWAIPWFTLTEVWAAGLGVAAVMCLLRGWRVSSLLLLTAAVAARELMLLLAVVWLVAWWLSDRSSKNWWFPTAALVGPAVVLGAHLASAPQSIGGVGSVSQWLHGAPEYLVGAVRFGYRQVPAGNWIALVVAAAALVGAVLARPRWRVGALVTATALPLLMLLAVSKDQWHYYWGACFTPLLVSIAPGVFSRLMPRESCGSGSPGAGPG